MCIELTLRERVIRLANLIERQTEVESDGCEFRHADTGVWYDVPDALRALLEGQVPADSVGGAF